MLMTALYGDFEPARIKHLEMVQAVIARLAGNSFLVKGWALTLATALLGFGVTSEESGLAIASIPPTVLFWGLDMYFLRTERLFRLLHDRIRTGELGDPFYMGATSPTFVNSLRPGQERDAASWRKAFLRPGLYVLYLGIIAAAVLTASLIGVADSHAQPSPSLTPSP
jgi:hypothetical protein